MHRFIPATRLISETKDTLRWRPRRCFSQMADNDNGVTVPKIPSFDYTPPPYTGPSADEILSKRKKYLSPSMFYFYNKPMNIVDGRMQYLFDENGRRYLDAFGGIATVSCGHCHPIVVNAIVDHTRRLQHSTILYLNHAIADFAESLANKLPGNLKVVFFTNSGTEANELAMMMARLYTGCQDIISLRNECLSWECFRDYGSHCPKYLEVQCYSGMLPFFSFTFLKFDAVIVSRKCFNY